MNIVKLDEGRVVLIHGDCLHIMRAVKSSSIDFIFADLPYGTTAGNWDTPIDLSIFWELTKRIVKVDTALAFTGSQPFTTTLISSNKEWFKYEWIWYKPGTGTGYVNARNMPMKYHENILMFSNGAVANGANIKMRYYPQDLVPINVKRKLTSKTTTYLGARPNQDELIIDATHTNYPRSIIEFARPSGAARIHPTQKPVELLEYLIKTYTNENDTVLDPTFGSCTTGASCVRLNRKFIGIERDEYFFNIGVARIEQELKLRNETIARVPENSR